jgi:2-polyprenyl-6-methoxyphenol hydroxylase-like FAD-dependent oxidoreductase
MEGSKKQKIVVIGAGPVGTLAAIYAAQRGHDVEVYELRNGTYGRISHSTTPCYMFYSPLGIGNLLDFRKGSFWETQS